MNAIQIIAIIGVCIIIYGVIGIIRHLSKDEIPGESISGTEAAVSFLIPLVGLVIYLVNTGQHPIKANKALKAAAYGFILGIVLFSILGYGFR